MSDHNLDLPAPSPSQENFIEYITQGKTLAEASALAYPDAADSLAIATTLLEENDFVRARFHMYMDEYHVSDRDIAKQLGRAFDLAESNPKASGAVLNATKVAIELKGLNPSPAKRDLNQAPIAYTQSQTINNYFEKAKEHISTEEIDTLTNEDDILVIDVIPKNDLFDDTE